LADLDETGHPITLTVRHEWSDFRCRVARITHDQRVDHLRERGEMFVVTRRGYKDSRLGDAGLTAVHQARHLDALCNIGGVGIVEHDRCGFAAKLQAHRLQRAAAARGDLSADGSRTGESDLVDSGVFHQQRAGLAVAGQNADDAGGQLRFLDELGKEERVERCLRGRLDDHGAAREQRRRQLPDHQELRHIPRHDRADDPDRPTTKKNFLAVDTWSGLVPLDSLGDRGKRAEHRPRQRGLSELGKRDRCAHLVGDQLSELAPSRRVEVG
jgi:hypothetical protein